MVVILHNIRSLHNVGSIFRTADGAGVEKLYLCGITPGPLNRFGEVLSDIKKTALGAENSIAWEKVKTTAQAIKELKKDGFKIVAVEQDKKSIPYFKLKANSSQLSQIALVLGAEVDGLPRSILKKCDTIVEIPMHGKKESLNVSIAFGIIAFHFVQRLKTK
ncbi:MAG: RNA methyltransferase [bacterium]|nr:RNA methyltransferase [bacterium]